MLDAFDELPDVGALDKLPSLSDGLGRVKLDAPNLLPVEELDRPAVEDLLDTEEGEFLRLIGNDRRLYARVKKWQANHPTASLPELVAFDWLAQQGIPFSFQTPFFGGRPVRGGVVADFVLLQGGRGIVWRIQGEYWHTKPGVRAKDLNERIRLLGTEYNGVRIEAVVDIWESAVYKKRPEVFWMALEGLEIGRA